MGTSDVELWERARAGDAEAFGALFTRHSRAVYNFCFRRTGSWTAAEDLSSLVFLHAWRVRDRVELQRESAAPFLFGIAVNLTRNHHRTLRRERAALGRLAPSADVADTGHAADERIDTERRMNAVLAHLSSLPKADREVFAVCAWGGLTYEEAAEALDVPVGTVRSRLSRARARLRERDVSGGHESSAPPLAVTTIEVPT